MNNIIPRTPFSTPLSGSARVTELRIKNILTGPKKRPPALFLAAMFAVCLFCGNLVSCQAAAASEVWGSSLLRSTSQSLGKNLLSLFRQIPGGVPASELDQYYTAGSLPLFQIEFSRLDGTEQGAWLEKLYSEDDFLFFSSAIRALEAGDPLLKSFAERAYQDGELAWFSTLADRMDEAALEGWLDQALADGRWDFQSTLYDRLGKDEEKDALEEELAEYQAVGVTHDGRNYYYQGQLVNIFLDIRPDSSFYALDLNPAGTVNVKILRNTDGAVTGAAYMTDGEAKELLNNMSDG